MKNQDPDSEIDNDLDLDLFTDPPGYYPPSPPPTTETYTLLSGNTVKLDLIGHSPLWGHHLWNAGRVTSSYLEAHPEIVCGKKVLELGAGAGLPSLVCAYLEAECVVITDYPDTALIENLKSNVERVKNEINTVRKSNGLKSRLVVQGHCWGEDCQSILSHITDEKNSGFDVLILADLLFNHSEHRKLLVTVQRTLKKQEDAKALVFFTPYRPWLLEKDLMFFEIVKNAGMKVEKILEEKTEKLMFEKDRGDPELRKTIFGYIVKWDLQMPCQQ
ncbi:Protein N-terminal and lysine N-methyltransferase efm7 [Erysiphe necator]|uniref:Protein N-terminal and lysine N-methyltransferase EFM7 n=1 Tax=Uncinula necator TaxID=52586 RepID=A0A0B1P7Y3_UNCNE|nr:Protein N-terminal and lysine N-methyltransferase efm7 [Erysiphe necator]KHJ34348.1 putative nicotinamide n-methyltransferase nnt1 [Erysiphe necator]